MNFAGAKSRRWPWGPTLAALVCLTAVASLGVAQAAPSPQEAAPGPQEAAPGPQEEAGQAEQGDEVQSQVQYPLAVAAGADGAIYVADLKLPGVWQIKDGQRSVYFAGSKQYRTPLHSVRCLAVDPNGKLLAGDSSTRQVFRFDDSGQPQPLGASVQENLGPFGVPMGLAFNSKGELFVSDLEFRCIWKVTSDGKLEKFVDTAAPTGITFDSQDQLWVVSRADDPLRRFAPDGTETVVVKGRPFQFPHNVAVDASGVAYVVDGYRRAVWKVAEGAEPVVWFEHERLVNPVDIKLVGEQLLLVDPRAKALFRINMDASAEVIDLAASQ